MNTSAKAGLVILGLLALVDLSAPFITDGEHPPLAVALISAALGLASLVCLPAAWKGSRTATLALAGTRVVSVLLAVPAFFVGGIPAGVFAIVGVTLALTVLGVVLALAGTRRVVTT